MSHLPINPLSPEEQQRVMNQMYLLMGKQVQSYHKHRHMGNNSSVSVELAQELMESIEYTIGLVGGVYAHRNIGEALVLGQEILESRLSKAKITLPLCIQSELGKAKAKLSPNARLRLSSNAQKQLRQIYKKS